VVSLTDDILKGSQNWRAPYRFIIGRQAIKDSIVEILGWTSEPEIAFLTFIKVVEEAEWDTTSYEYFLHDSFHIDAYEFCKEAYQAAEIMFEEVDDF